MWEDQLQSPKGWLGCCWAAANPAHLKLAYARYNKLINAGFIVADESRSLPGGREGAQRPQRPTPKRQLPR